jgi:hypothetical protein
MDEEEEKVESSPLTLPETAETAPPGEVNLEDAFQGLFKTSASGTGEEELLRIASTYSRQISASMIKAVLWLEWSAAISRDPEYTKRMTRFIDRWLELKQFNNSDQFVMRALDSISLRKFIGENAFKINIEK